MSATDPFAQAWSRAGRPLPSGAVRWIAGLLVAAAVAALALWTFVQNPAGAVEPPELRTDRARPQGDAWVSMVDEPRSLNPFTTASATARSLVLRFVFDTLADWDAERQQLRPALAARIDSAADGRTHTFTLRDGVRFSDGTPLTMDDVRFTFDVARDPEVVLASIGPAMRLVETLTVLDERRFTVTLALDHFAALPRVATGWPVVQKRHFLAAVQELARARGVPPPGGPGAPGFGGLLMEVSLCGPGTGPYRLGRLVGSGAPAWIANRSLTLVQNPTSWRLDAEPECWNLGALQLDFVTDRAAQIARVRAQKADWLFVPDAEAFLEANPDIARHYRYLVYDYEALGHYFVLWNHRRPPLDDARVRRALTMLFDRESLVRTVFGGRGRIAAAWFKPGTPSYPSAPAPLPFDVEAARALLRDAGVADGWRLELTLAAGVQEHRKIYETARAAFRQAGIELVDRPLEAPQLDAARRSGEFDGLLGIQYHEPWIDPFDELHSSQAGAGQNWGAVADPEMDRLLEAARVERDPTARAALHQQFNARFHELQPVTLLVHPLASLLFHSRFRDSEPTRSGLVPKRWWVAPEERLHGVAR